MALRLIKLGSRLKPLVSNCSCRPPRCLRGGSRRGLSQGSSGTSGLRGIYRPKRSRAATTAAASASASASASAAARAGAGIGAGEGGDSGDEAAAGTRPFLCNGRPVFEQQQQQQQQQQQEQQQPQQPQQQGAVVHAPWFAAQKRKWKRDRPWRALRGLCQPWRCCGAAAVVGC